jgi:hypothetical protein
MENKHTHTFSSFFFSRIELSKLTAQDALKLVSKILNVKLLQAINFTATYYGKSIQGQHVCLLVKCSKDSQSSFSINIKASTASLAKELLAELTALLM